MATVIQIILPLIFVIFTNGQYVDPYRSPFNSDYFGFSRRGDGRYHPSSSSNQNPPYKFKNDNFYNDGLSKAFDSYFGYPGPFDKPNFDNMPLVPNGLFNVPNKFNYPGPMQLPLVNGMNDKTPAEKLESNNNIPADESNNTKKDKLKSNDKISASINNDNKVLADIHGQNSEECRDKSKQFDTETKPENIPPKTNEAKHDDCSEGGNSSKVALSAKKDYLLVDDNGNNAYILHENVPSTVVLNNNQPTGNNVVYVTPNKNVVQQPNNPTYQYVNGQPVQYAKIGTGNNPTGFVAVNNQPNNNILYVPVVQNGNNPQPGNPTYQVVNGQPMPVNIPLTANRVDSNGNNNVLLNPIQNNPSPTNYNPSYILIYANGQLTQIPGIIINPQQSGLPVQNGYNGVPLTNTPNSNVPNGYSPMLLQVPNTNVPVSNNYPQANTVIQNPQPYTNLQQNVLPVQNGYNGVPLTNAPNSNVPNGYSPVTVQVPNTNVPVSNNYPQTNTAPQNPQPTTNPQQSVLPAQNVYNGMPLTTVPNSNVPNGYSPMLVQVPNTNVPVSNNNPQTGTLPQNPQPNTNLGTYNVPNGYIQSGVIPNYSPAVAINNQNVQPAVAQPVNNNAYTYQQPPPTPQKEANNIGLPQNNVPITYDQPKTSAVVPETSTEGRNYGGIQPAFMFSFKETDEDKGEVDKDHKEDVKIKKEKETVE